MIPNLLCQLVLLCETTLASALPGSTSRMLVLLPPPKVLENSAMENCDDDVQEEVDTIEEV